jgi:hypothetical protein
MSLALMPPIAKTILPAHGEIAALPRDEGFYEAGRDPTVAKADWWLDRNCKTSSRFAFRALEDTDFMTGFSRLDASQPHRFATLVARKNSDLRAAV